MALDGVKMAARGVAGGRGLISECARMRVPTGRLRIVSTQPIEVAELQEGPPSPGRYIRDQRQRRGMSIEQLAIDTKIPRPSIEALEEDRFSALPGPVFVRGFFRCCARSLGLDPEAVVGLLQEHLRAQQAGSKPARRERAVQAVRSIEGAARSPAPRSPALSPAPAEVARPEAARPALAGGGVVAGMFDDLGAALARAFAQLPQSRTLMWIVVGLVVAAIAVTTFVVSGISVTTPHS